MSVILQTATEHEAKPHTMQTTSVSRVVPLMMATIFSCVALLLGLWANRRGRYLYRRIIVGFLSITLILMAYAFGSTYDSYLKGIKQVCKSPTNTILCAKITIQIEAILFAVALGLLFVGLLFWFAASSFFTANMNDPVPESFSEKPSKHWSFGRNNGNTPTTPRKAKRQTQQQQYSEPPLEANYQQQDDLAVWRDVAMFDENAVWEDYGQEKKMKKHDSFYYDSYNNPIPQQHTKHYSNSNPHYRQQQKNAKGFYEQQKRASAHLANESHEKLSLTPPPPLANEARGYNKARVTSGTRKKSTPNADRNSRVTRNQSNDSALTFGAAQQQKNNRRKSSGRPISELEPTYQQNYKTTPTSMSPHPFQYPAANTTKNTSYCMTPYYEDQGGSSGGSSSSYQQQGYFQQHVPILGMPPVEHPLSKKKIKDKRIQSYLQPSSS